MVTTTKKCRRCGIEKPVSELKKDLRNGDGYSSFCKECHKAASVAWQKANPDKVNAARRQRYSKKKAEINAVRRESYNYDKVRWVRLRQLYKVTREQYESMLLSQGGKCAICGRGSEEFLRQLSVDHDHSCCPSTPTCGKCTRGLLCHHCNSALHSIERDKGWLSSAVRYLGGGEIK